MGEKLYLFYDPPLHLVKGNGVWVEDASGHRYLDCYNNVPHVGHCHPYVSEAIVRQARRLNTNTRYLTEESLDYAERLAATAAPGLSAVIFVNSGSEANDVAWRMAKAWTKKRGGLCMEFSYHGITEASDAFSPSNAPSAPLRDFIRTLTPPDDYRGPYLRGETRLAERYAALADAPINSLNEAGYGVAALILDSAFMTNGMLEAPAGYVAQVVEKVRKAGGLFIADEVQSGFGRLGSDMWGHRHHGVVPDFITIGKPAGNGHPLGAVITRPEILEHFTSEAAFFSTFGGNNVSCAAGIAVLDVIRDEDLIANARETGAYLKQGLRDLMKRHVIIGDVRGRGLALGMELVIDRKTRKPAPAAQITLLNLVRNEGVLVGGEGEAGNIVKIRPPIVFRREHADIAIAAVDRALTRL
jgi:4-aminobutyrate aminotransferase-like enzyme